MTPLCMYDSFIRSSHFKLIWKNNCVCVKLCNGKGQQEKITQQGLIFICFPVPSIAWGKEVLC